MRFENLDPRMRDVETAHDRCVLPEIYIVARLDGRAEVAPARPAVGLPHQTMN